MASRIQAPPGTDSGWLKRVRAFARRLKLPAGHLPLLVRALTHRSLSDLSPHGDNERLEFLGDSVLALLVNDYLFRAFPDLAEGPMTRMKVRYVSEPSLAESARALDLGSLLAIAPGDEAAGVRERSGTLCDVFEAVLGALYLAGGLEAAREFVARELIGRVDPTEIWDYKSNLQELYQERFRITPTYRTEVESGPAHDRTFSSEVLAGDRRIGEGSGRTKKLAEQAAAGDALSRLEQADPEEVPDSAADGAAEVAPDAAGAPG